MAEKPLTDDEIRALRALLLAAATTPSTPEPDEEPAGSWYVPPTSNGWA